MLTCNLIGKYRLKPFATFNLQYFNLLLYCTSVHRVVLGAGVQFWHAHQSHMQNRELQKNCMKSNNLLSNCYLGLCQAFLDIFSQPLFINFTVIIPWK